MAKKRVSVANMIAEEKQPKRHRMMISLDDETAAVFDAMRSEGLVGATLVSELVSDSLPIFRELLAVWKAKKTMRAPSQGEMFLGMIGAGVDAAKRSMRRKKKGPEDSEE